MAKKKFLDYEGLKIEFFTSEHKGILGFYREKFWKKIMPGNVKAKTKGWWREKTEWKKAQLLGTQEEIKAELKEAFRPSIEALEKKLGNILKLVDLKTKAMYEDSFSIEYDKHGGIIYKTDKKWNYILDKEGARIPFRKLKNNISATELNRLYDMIKTELGEPWKIHNNKLEDEGGGKNLPPITAVKVEIINNNTKIEQNNIKLEKVKLASWK